MVYQALLLLMRTPRLPAVHWTDAPYRFKRTRLFHCKAKSGFCACAITFQTQSTITIFNQSSINRQNTEKVINYKSNRVTAMKITFCNTFQNSWVLLKKCQLNYTFFMQNFIQSKELIVMFLSRNMLWSNSLKKKIFHSCSWLYIRL